MEPGNFKVRLSCLSVIKGRILVFSESSYYSEPVRATKISYSAVAVPFPFEEKLEDLRASFSRTTLLCMTLKG